MILLLRMVLQAPITGIWAIFKAYNPRHRLVDYCFVGNCNAWDYYCSYFRLLCRNLNFCKNWLINLILVTRENLTGLRVIRAFNNEKIEEEKFEKANVDLTNTNLFVNRLMVVMQPMMMLIFNVTALGIVWIGAHLIGSGNLEIGNMIAFMQYAMQVIMAFLNDFNCFYYGAARFGFGQSSNRSYGNRTNN